MSTTSGPRQPSIQRSRGAGRHAKRIVVTVGGVLLLALGVLLLILPGPGLLLVLAGMTVLANEYEWARRRTAPVRRRAMETAEASVASPLRIAGTALAGLVLIAAGIAWGLVESLPVSGWPTGSSLIISGFILLGLLVYSIRYFRPAAP